MTDCCSEEAYLFVFSDWYQHQGREARVPHGHFKQKQFINTIKKMFYKSQTVENVFKKSKLFIIMLQ